MRAAVYSGTRNLYPDMIPAIKSLIANSTVDRIYLLTEDDTIGEPLPAIVETVNLSGQRFFPPDGPNANSPLTYMSMLRVCLTKIFPELDRILWLDVDTIVVDHIDELWDLDMGENYFAMVLENCNPYRPCGPNYYNAGVCMFNLKQIREEKADDQMIWMLNETRYNWIDEYVMNRVGAYGKIVELPLRFNEAVCNGFTDNPAIIHWAGFRNFQTDIRACRREYLKKYRDMSWEEVLHAHSKQQAALRRQHP